MLPPYGCPQMLKIVKGLKRCKTLWHVQFYKAPRNTPIECLLGDLGWQPVATLQDKLRVKYYDRLCKIPLHRWPKLLFNATSMIYTCNSKNKHLRWLSFVHNLIYLLIMVLTMCLIISQLMIKHFFIALVTLYWMLIIRIGEMVFIWNRPFGIMRY